MREVYLDNSATTRVRPEVVDIVVSAMRAEYHNPAAAYRAGLEAEQLLLDARRRLAAVIGARPEEMFFTSGGTESNNWALTSAAQGRSRQGRQIITTAVEHPSVLRVCQRLGQEGFEVVCLPVDEYGVVDIDAFAAGLSPETILISTMQVNNEVGAVMPLAQIAALRRQKAPAALWHVDAIQGFAKLPVPVYELGIDLLSVSAHKLAGPKGAGALFIRQGTRLPPFILGGDQENGLRSGTENVPGISGLGLAASLLWEQRERVQSHLLALKDRLLQRIFDDIPGAVVNGPRGQLAAAHILNVSFPGVKGEVLLHALEQRGVLVSTGSACSARKSAGSHVLESMGLSADRRDSALRFSFSPDNSLEDINYAADCLREIVPKLRQIMAGERD